MKRIFTLVLMLCICLGLLVPGVRAAETDPALENSWRYEDGIPMTQLDANDGLMLLDIYPENQTAVGIDVSEHQGRIDWDTVRNQIDFAIIRTGYGQDIEEQHDTWFTYNVEACERLNIPYGVYHYSYAKTPERVQGEADHALRLIQLHCGENLKLPVYFDMEETNTISGKSASEIYALADTFCSAVKAAGFTPGIYANTNWWNNHLVDPRFNEKIESGEWSRWVAQFNTHCEYDGDYDIWQYSSTGYIKGIAGFVDMNYLLVDKSTYGITTSNQLLPIPYMATDKDSYCLKEPILVTTYRKNDQAWNGLYKKGDVPGDIESFYWFNSGAGGSTKVNILTQTAGGRTDKITAGEYTVIHFQDQNYIALETVDITLRDHAFDQEIPLPEFLAEKATSSSPAKYYKSCSCGETNKQETFTYGEPIDHEHKFDKQVADSKYRKTAATHFEPAVYYCSCYCGEAGTEDTFSYGDPVPHTFDRVTISKEYLKTPATCTTLAVYYATCSCGERGGENDVVAYGEPAGHSWDPATCKAPKTCSVCGISEGEKLDGHRWEEATCTAPETCPDCKLTRGEALPHSWVDASCLAPKTCSVCKTTEGKRLDHNYVDGICSSCKAPDPNYAPPIYRIAGEDRFDTAFQVADRIKADLGKEKFDTIIVANGKDFADALSGTYLAAEKKAPILLSYRAEHNDRVSNYIRNNLAENGTVYVIGGPNAVPEDMTDSLVGLSVKRLAGANRFETNLAVLKEAGVSAGDEILVCTGTDFADCLSAAATGKPILLAYKQLTGDQLGYLSGLSGSKFWIIGGEHAVKPAVEEGLKAFGQTERISGAHRYETSIKVAEKFFGSPETAVLAYARNFPDGLCGGALAAINGAPLLLTDTKYSSFAEDYTAKKGISSGTVLGGAGLISDKAVSRIFK